MGDSLMSKVLGMLWNDDDGFIVSTELVLIATILVLSLGIGLSQIAADVNVELGDVGAAISSINQSFSFGGASGHHAIVEGTVFVDTADAGGSNGVNCVTVCNANVQGVLSGG
jgi:hypothetical protein